MSKRISDNKAIVIVALYASVTDDKFIQQQENCIAQLNQQELKRFNNMKHPLKKKQFLLSRHLIRCALQQQGISNISDYRIEDYQRLIINNGQYTFSISITHSADLAAVIITDKKYKIGIDIEKIKVRNFSELTEVICTKSEKESFGQQEAPDKAFYQLWTTKEALAKASQIALETLYHCDCSAVMLNHLGVINCAQSQYQFHTSNIGIYIATIVIDNIAVELGNSWQYYAF